MLNHQISVTNYLSEEKDKLFKIVNNTILTGKKLHIGAPVGTGKTTFAIDLVEHLGIKYKTIFLFPIIAISEQAQVEFEKRNIDAEIFNSKVKIDDVKDCQVILSTIDSAHKLIDDGFLSESKVLIILDETHTYLQKARENFSKSVDAILSSGYPIIGLSATPSLWVNHYLFNIKEYVEVEVTSFKPKVINPIEVAKGLIRYVANQASINPDDKWIIFLERIKLQEGLQLLIKQQRPNSKVVILNADTKKNEEKKTWKYLMKEGKLPNKVDIAIINSVAQAGINLKNSDIDKVILVDKHDTFGMAQFLGRCRNYTGEFDYYFSPGGRNLRQQVNSDFIQSRIKMINSILHFKNQDYHKDLVNLLPLLDGTFAIDSGGSLVANKCMVASKTFSLLRDVPGAQTIRDLSIIYAKELVVNPTRQVPGITGSTAAQNKLRRDAARKKLVELLSKHSSLVLTLTNSLDADCDYNDATELVKNPNRNLFQAIVENKPFFSKAKDRKILKKVIKFAKKAERSLHRVSVATELFIQSGRKKRVLKKYIQTSDRAIQELYSAKELFENKIRSEYVIKDTIEQLEGLIGQVKSTNDWKSNVRTTLGLAKESDRLVNSIFNSCLRLKNKDAYPTRKRVTHRELVGVNKSFQEYLGWKSTLKDFVNPDS